MSLLGPALAAIVIATLVAGVVAMLGVLVFLVFDVISEVVA